MGGPTSDQQAWVMQTFTLDSSLYPPASGALPPLPDVRLRDPTAPPDPASIQLVPNLTLPAMPPGMIVPNAPPPLSPFPPVLAPWNAAGPTVPGVPPYLSPLPTLSAVPPVCAPDPDGGGLVCTVPPVSATIQATPHDDDGNGANGGPPPPRQDPLQPPDGPGVSATVSGANGGPFFGTVGVDGDGATVGGGFRF